jgi:hypothetical protein
MTVARSLDSGELSTLSAHDRLMIAQSTAGFSRVVGLARRLERRARRHAIENLFADVVL